MSSTEFLSNTNPALDSVVVRLAGDSGDGMQVTGSRFTEEAAIAGNDLATRPDFPAEIRAPAGSIAGVSAFQIHFGSSEIHTAGDEVDALIAMNPAALAANISDLRTNGILICNSDAFIPRNLTRAGYSHSPLDDEDLQTRFQLVAAPISTLTHEALKDLPLGKSAIDRSKNFFALGILCWLYNRGTEQTIAWIKKRFAQKQELVEANILALHGGQAFAQASELFPVSFEIKPARLAPGRYRNITGNQGIAFGVLGAGTAAGIPVTYAGYPITPASDILHELSKHKDFGVRTFQAEDEIAACCVALGASFAGGLGVTASSGPGILLKQETIGLAVMTELPLLVIDVQRAGPSTGMPTKTEQSDLLSVLFGRNGECPLVVLAIASPADSFATTFEACRIAIEHMTPVVLLSDGHIGNGSEPWKLPDVSTLPSITRRRMPMAQEEPTEYQPYLRDPESLARYWQVPGMPGFEHRIGGIEKKDGTGNISYDPDNHEKMVRLRQEKVDRVAHIYPETTVFGARGGELLLVSWGSTEGPIRAAVERCLARGLDVAHVHLRHLNPLPRDLETILQSYKRIMVAELNLGQLHMILRARFLLPARSLCKVKGQQFKIAEIEAAIIKTLESGTASDE